MKPLLLAVVALILPAILPLPTPALAQEPPVGEDWQVHRAPEQKAIVAAAAFDNGITLVARCSDNVFDLILSGLPEARGKDIERQLIFIIDDEADQKPYSWTVGDDRTVAFSRVPAMIARQVAEGGNLQIVIPAEPGGRRTRYVMELTRSGSAIEETLTACGRPLVDPRDDRLEGDGDGLPNGIEWVRPPRPFFPDSPAGRPSVGYVTVSCLVGTDGRPEECQTESEQPPGFNLGRAALRALNSARLGQNEEARLAGRPFEGAMIVFTTTFRME